MAGGGGGGGGGVRLKVCAVLKIILANLPFAELRLWDVRCQSRLQMWDVSHTCKCSQDTQRDTQEPPPEPRSHRGAAWWESEGDSPVQTL